MYYKYNQFSFFTQTLRVFLADNLCAVYSFPFSTVLHQAPLPLLRSPVCYHQAHLAIHSLHCQAHHSSSHLHRPSSTLSHTLAKFFLFISISLTDFFSLSPLCSHGSLALGLSLVWVISVLSILCKLSPILLVSSLAMWFICVETQENGQICGS